MKLINRVHTKSGATCATAFTKSCCVRRYLSVCLKPCGEAPLSDCDAAEHGIKYSDDRGSPFHFDVLETARRPSVNPVDVERVSQVSLKTFHIPDYMRRRLALMVRQFGHKRDINTLVEELRKRKQITDSAELPRVLSSKLVSIQNLDKFERLKDLHVWRTANGLDDEDAQSWDEGQEENHAQDTSTDSSVSESMATRGRVSNHKMVYRGHWADTMMSKSPLELHPETAIAYCASFAPSHYVAHYRVLSEVKKRMPRFSPKRLLLHGAKEGSGIL